MTIRNLNRRFLILITASFESEWTAELIEVSDIDMPIRDSELMTLEGALHE